MTKIISKSTETVVSPFTVKSSDYVGLLTPELSDWSCNLFGSGPMGICFTPQKGKEPNAFWRLMQYLCFGNEWFDRKEQNAK